MKKQLRLAAFTMIIATLFVACSGVKKLPATLAGSARARFVGTWTLTKVTYSGLLPGAVQTLFDQAPPDDFNGSTWELTNSGNGTYTLGNGTAQKIFWAYNSTSGEVFQFKKLYQGESARKVEEGYQLSVGSIGPANMVLNLPVTLGDKTAYVVLSFDKIK